MKQFAPTIAQINTPNQTPDSWGIHDLRRILRRRWTIVVLAIMSGAIFAVVFQLCWPRSYESKAQLLVVRKDPRLATKGIESGTDLEPRVTDELLATHMQLLQSRGLVDRALKDSGLSELPSIVDHLRNQQTPSEYVIENLSVTRGGTGQSRMAHTLNLTLRGSSELDCQRILRAIVKSYQSFVSEMFQDVNQEAATLINQGRKELAADLKTAEADYNEFRQKSSDLIWKPVSEATNLHRVFSEEILQERVTLQLTRAETLARLDAVNDRLDGREVSELSDLEMLALIDDKNLPRVLLLMTQQEQSNPPDSSAELHSGPLRSHPDLDTLAAMQLKEKSMSMRLGDRHPELVKLRKQIASLKVEVEKQKDDAKTVNHFPSGSRTPLELYCRLLKDDILALDHRDERLKALAEESAGVSNQMVADEIQGESLRREVQRKQTLFDAAVDRLREINLARNYGGFANHVLSEPSVGLKVRPRASMSLAMGIALSVGIGVLGIAIAEFRDRRFRTIAEIESAMQLPVLGRIPLDAEWIHKCKSQPRTRSDVGVSLLESGSAVGNAFRMFRSSLLFAIAERKQQIVCLTSPSQGDGKSFVAANLAIALGQLGRRVLVIDSDLRHLAQHDVFFASNNRGLTTIIGEQLDPSDLIQATPHKNVWHMSSGPTVPNPAEFLGTGEFGGLLESLRDKYDHILLDTPSVLAAADAVILAAIADTTIIVVRADRTTQVQARLACLLLRQAGANIEGTVVNQLMPGPWDEETCGPGYPFRPAVTHAGVSNETDTTTEDRHQSQTHRQPSFKRNGHSDDNG